VVYETETVPEIIRTETTASEKGWVSRYRIIQTVVSVIATRLVVRLLSPDGSVVVSQYSVPTQIVLSTYRKPPITQFLGIGKAEVLPPQTQPSPVPPAPMEEQVGVRVA